MELGELMTSTLGVVTLIGNIAFIALFLSRVVAYGVYQKVMRIIGKNAALLGFLLTGGSLLGSLIYSEVVGYPACVLCWVSRIFMYPLPFVFALALWRRETVVFPYTFLLALIGALVGLYQWGKEMLLLYSDISLPCPAVAGLPSCDKIYILEYGYITIAMLALNAFLWTLVVLWAGMKHRHQ